MNQSNECIICGAHLEYLDNPIEMECAICHRKFTNNVRCEQGHYVCDECHTSGIDSIVGICLKETSQNPIEIIEKMMSLPTCHMHGPEHHIMVGASLITAYKNAGGEVDLEWALSEIVRRGKQVPGGACGNWGACGAGISTGMFVSIITKSTPLAGKTWGLSNLMTSRALEQVAKHGGPRCCKRDSYLSMLAAIGFVREQLGIEMKRPEKVICSRSVMNNQCRGANCLFHTPVFKFMSTKLHKKTFQELTTDELYELLRVRNEVFVVEQNCPYQDLDYDDQKAIHLWLTADSTDSPNNGKLVAMARVCPAGTHMKEVSIGRVITTERGKGYGKQIMLHAIDAAVEYFNATGIDIEAQEYAKGFYEGVGFKQSSETFILDGIPHIKMTWSK